MDSVARYIREGELYFRTAYTGMGVVLEEAPEDLILIYVATGESATVPYRDIISLRAKSEAEAMEDLILPMADAVDETGGEASDNV